MLLTQWAFVAPVILQSKKLGIKETTLSLLDDFIYLWTVIGTNLGIEDR